MLNEDYKNKAIIELENANDKYTIVFKRTIDDMTRLFQSRQRAIRTIMNIESYVNGLANKPREYERQIGEIKIRYVEFNNRIEEIKRLDEEKRNVNYHRGIGTGILVGAGGVAFAPSAALAVAMTFGTASTGTAIASLSGVAATNAALAWLGGGALAAGGAGMIGGQTLLTMAGPIGWAIGGVSVASGVLLRIFANIDIAKKAEDATSTIIRETERIKETDVTVCSWNKETIKLSNELTKKLTSIRRKKDYSFFTEDDKHELIIVMNMTEVLSKKLGDTIS
ncbi:MAG: hypothetical protein ACI4S0_00060 [Dorea sp.]